MVFCLVASGGFNASAPHSWGPLSSATVGLCFYSCCALVPLWTCEPIMSNIKNKQSGRQQQLVSHWWRAHTCIFILLAQKLVLVGGYWLQVRFPSHHLEMTGSFSRGLKARGPHPLLPWFTDLCLAVTLFWFLFWLDKNEDWPGESTWRCCHGDTHNSCV